MLLFTNTQNSLFELREKTFKLEKEIQLLFEKNLMSITGLHFVNLSFLLKATELIRWHLMKTVNLL